MSEFKVLVPLDGSRLAEHSLAYLDALRSLGESHIRLVSVLDESEEYFRMSSEDAAQRESNLLSTYLREVAADIEKHLGISVETRLERGIASDIILNQAMEFRADLLIITTHGRSGMARWRLGSVADKVIRGASCDTLVVGPKASENQTWLEARILPAFRSILVPLDGSQLAEEALPRAILFADAFDSTLHFVNVVEPPSLATAVGMYGDVYYSQDIIDSMVTGAKDYLQHVPSQMQTNVHRKVLVGPTEIELANYAKENRIDLVVMTSHGRSGFVRTALGSVTDRMLAGPAPVLVVRPTHND